MATFLDALSELASDESARAVYRRDPLAWLAAQRIGDLCGEDVAVAEPLLRGWLGADLPPPVTPPPDPVPARGEDDLASAVRRIDHLLSGFTDAPGATVGDVA